MLFADDTPSGGNVPGGPVADAAVRDPPGRRGATYGATAGAPNP